MFRKYKIVARKFHKEDLLREENKEVKIIRRRRLSVGNAVALVMFKPSVLTLLRIKESR